MRLKLDGTTIYATECTVHQSYNTIHEIEIKEGYIDIDINWNSKERLKAEREKVWEMARKVYNIVECGGLSSSDLNECFGSPLLSHVFGMDVDKALEKYEAWKKKKSVEELLSTLKPQDVVAYNSGINFGYRILMITRATTLDGKRYTFNGITCDGCTIVLHIFIDDEFTIDKIGRVVETTDILGEIKKIEDEWRKNRCGS